MKNRRPKIAPYDTASAAITIGYGEETYAVNLAQTQEGYYVTTSHDEDCESFLEHFDVDAGPFPSLEQAYSLAITTLFAKIKEAEFQMKPSQIAAEIIECLNEERRFPLDSQTARNLVGTILQGFTPKVAPAMQR